MWYLWRSAFSFWLKSHFCKLQENKTHSSWDVTVEEKSSFILNSVFSHFVPVVISWMKFALEYSSLCISVSVCGNTPTFSLLQFFASFMVCCVFRIFLPFVPAEFCPSLPQSRGIPKKIDPEVLLARLYRFLASLKCFGFSLLLMSLGFL